MNTVNENSYHAISSESKSFKFRQRHRIKRSQCTTMVYPILRHWRYQSEHTNIWNKPLLFICFAEIIKVLMLLLWVQWICLHFIRGKNNGMCRHGALFFIKSLSKSRSHVDEHEGISGTNDNYQQQPLWRNFKVTLTHWGRDKMDAISQTTSTAFSWMKMFEFRLKFHRSLFPVVQLTIFQHWFR